MQQIFDVRFREPGRNYVTKNRLVVADDQPAAVAAAREQLSLPEYWETDSVLPTGYVDTEPQVIVDTSTVQTAAPEPVVAEPEDGDMKEDRRAGRGKRNP